MKKSLLVLVFVLVLSALLTACSPYESTKNSVPYVANVEKTEVSPNWSFIDLGELEGTVQDNTGAIGNAVLDWEQNHPDREIVNLQIIYQEYSYGTFAHVTGISIYSLPIVQK